MKTLVVYGSLKSGKYNHPLLADSEYLGPTTLVGSMYRVSSYPALLDKGDTEYPAEVYSVSERVYEAIRGMELGAGYKEMLANIKGEDGQEIEAAVYYADERLAEHCEKNCEFITEY